MFRASDKIAFSCFNGITAQKMKFSIKDFFSKCDQVHRNCAVSKWSFDRCFLRRNLSLTYSYKCNWFTSPSSSEAVAMKCSTKKVIQSKFDQVHKKTPAMELLFRYGCKPGFQPNEIHEIFLSGYIIEHLWTTASVSF